MNDVKTRFAPSPTGFLHIGGVRTAIFAWLVARQSGGEFILRIEDTDRARFVEGATEHIQHSLGWLGLNPDGKPAFQSQRLDTYQRWAEKLIDSGRAYADPYSASEVQTFRELAAGDKKPFLYRDYRPLNPPKWDGKSPLRFKSDPKKYSWRDEVMGDLSAGAEAIDDFVLVKSDGYPTYNFAHIVDDTEMNISHVIRGQEFVASQPNYLNLYEALNIELPKFATVPPIMNPAGNKKLSKRDGAKDILEYKNEGFLPEAMLSFLATLGWNDGTEQEVFTRDELLKEFDLSRVQRSGARFDERRLSWASGHFIRELSSEELYEKAGNYWPPEANGAADDYKKSVLSLVQERLKYFAELPDLTSFFFTDLPYDADLISNNKQLKKLGVSELKSLLETSRQSFEASDFSESDLTDRLNNLLEVTGQKPAVLFSLIRVATTNAPSSPALAETMTVLGKEKTLARIEEALIALGG